MDGATELKARAHVAVLIRGKVRVPDSVDLRQRPGTSGIIIRARQDG